MFVNKWTNCIVCVKKAMSLSQSSPYKSSLLWDSDRWDSGAESSALQPSHLSDKHLISL